MKETIRETIICKDGHGTFRVVLGRFLSKFLPKFVHAEAEIFSMRALFLGSIVSIKIDDVKVRSVEKGIADNYARNISACLSRKERSLDLSRKEM